MRVFFVMLTILLAAFVRADVDSVRTAFENEMLSCCAKGSYMRHYSHAPDSARYDREGGTTNYLFVLSHRGSTRARFIRGKVSAGRFRSGRLFVFGQVPEFVTEEAFEHLRDTEALFAIRLDGVKRPYVCLYPSRDFETPKVYPVGESLRSETPAKDMLGALPSGGVYSTRGSNLRFFVFGCRTTYRGADGVEVALGETSFSQSVLPATVLQKCRAALEERYPGRAGKVSDRDVMDWCKTCTVIYEPVSSFYGNW